MVRACERVERCAHCKYPVSAKSIRAHENHCARATAEIRAHWRRTGRWVESIPRRQRNPAAQRAGPKPRVRPERWCPECGKSTTHLRSRQETCGHGCRAKRMSRNLRAAHERRRSEAAAGLLAFIEARRFGVTILEIGGGMDAYEGATTLGVGAGRRLARALARLRQAGRVVRVLVDGRGVYTLPGREHLAESRAA